MRNKNQISVEKKAAGRKRKAEEPGEDRPRAKRVRGKRGSLNKIRDMPTDVLFEIFGFLEPLDLLHLSRISKSFRDLLMTRSSVSVWKAAQSNVPRMPDCPPDLSHPQYADLAFGKHCYFCGRNLPSNRIFWAARLRTCTRCLKDSTHFIKNYREYDYHYQDILGGCLPTMPQEKGYMAADVAPLGLKTLLLEEYNKATDKQAWVAQKREERKTIDLHAKECSFWLYNLDSYRAAELASLVAQRRSTVAQLIHRLGWDQELSSLPSSTPKLQDQSLITDMCQHQLTPHSLSFLTNFINTTMKSIHARQLAEARMTRLHMFLPKLKEVYEAFVVTLPANAIYPTFGDIVLGDEAIRRIIDTTAYSDSSADASANGNRFNWVSSLFPEIMQRWTTKIEAKVRLLVTREPGSDHADGEADVNSDVNVLALATTWLACTQCHALLRHPRVLIHRCATRPHMLDVEMNSDDNTEPNIDVAKRNIKPHPTKSSVPKPPPSPSPDPYIDPDPGMTADPDATVVLRLFQQVKYNARNCICVVATPHLMECMGKVIRLCGLDPGRTTAEQMDHVNPVVECLACDDPRKGRAMMTWEGVMRHYQDQHRRSKDTELNSMRLSILNDSNDCDADEKKFVQAQMAATRARCLASEDCKSLVCAKCNLVGNLVDLKRHVKSNHRRNRPTDEDILPVIDENHIPDVYWLWPPRELEE